MGTIMYKIMKHGKQEGWWATLFHGIKGSKQVKAGEWLYASVKSVRDGSGGKYYYSGIHVLPSLEDAVEYMKNFDNPEDKTIVLVECRGYEKKNHSRGNVYLCNAIKIIDEVEV